MGLLAASCTGSPPPEDTEERMARFARLLDTAIANADSRDQLKASRARLLSAGDERVGGSFGTSTMGRSSGWCKRSSR